MNVPNKNKTKSNVSNNSLAVGALVGFNLIMFLFFSTLTVLSFLFTEKLQNGTLTLGIGVIFIVVSFISTSKKKYLLAKSITTILPPYIFLVASLFFKSEGIVNNVFTFLVPKFFIILYLLAPIVFFGIRESKKMVLTILIILPSILLFDYFHTLVGVEFKSLNYDPNFYPAFIAVFSLFYFFALTSMILVQKSNQIFRLGLSTKNLRILDDQDKLKKINETLELVLTENEDYESFLESSSDVIFMIDKFGKQVYYNKKIEEILGYNRDEMIGKSFTKFVPIKEIPKYLSKLKEVFLNKEIKPFETQILHKDGYNVDVEIVGKLFRTKKGLFALGSMRDISQRLIEKQTLQFQSNLYKILNITSHNKKLPFILQDVLDQILNISCLDIQRKGLIFLTNNVGDLELAAHKNVDSLISTCSNITKGQCLCGTVLETKKKLFCNSVGHDHTIQPKGMKPHGHYVIPILNNNNVLGVLNIYIKQGEKRDVSVETFLEGVANILARRILSDKSSEKLIKRNIEFKNQGKQLRSTLDELNDSINYAQFLQKSLLPNQETINDHFKDSSFFFKPKDKVSGDFYFAHNYGNNLYFGVGDCTGHGIPGSMLASMSIEAVKTVLNTHPNEMPNDLLDKLRTIAKERFSINLHEKRSDAMDAAMCLYNKETGVLHYSGGFINLLIVKNNREIITYKATKCPIGTYPVEHDFELHEIILEKGDVIYLSSDGYVDQFGYEEGSKRNKPSKFKHKRFRELLIGISHLPCNEQVVILKQNLLKWRGDIEQIDDITVFVARH